MGSKNSSNLLNQENVITKTFVELKDFVSILKKARHHGRECRCNKFELLCIPMNTDGLDSLKTFFQLIGPDLNGLKLSFSQTERINPVNQFVLSGEIFGTKLVGLNILEISFPFQQLGELRQLPGAKFLRPQNCILTHESMESIGKRRLESVMTSYCSIDLEFFHGCTNLFGLVMRNSRDISPPKRQILLPAIQVFNYQIPDVHKCDGRSCYCFETDTSDAEVNLKEIVFFDKREGESWDVQNITSLHCDIEIFRSGKRIFNLDQEKGEIITTLSTPLMSQILYYGNLNGFNVKMLGWNGIIPNIEDIPHNLKHLAVKVNSNDRAFDESWIRSLLLRCTQLEELTLANGLGLGPNVSTLDIARLPKTIKCLTLKGINLTYSPNVELDLEYFKYVNPSPFVNGILSNFSTIFKTRVLRVGMVQLGEGKSILLEEWYKIGKGELMVGRASSSYRRPCTKFQSPPLTNANENVFFLNRNGEKSAGLFSTLSMFSAYEKDYETNLTPFLLEREK